MRQYINQRLVSRNAKISKVFTLLGLALLIGSLVISFTNPEVMNLLLIVVFIGTFISQVGLAMHNRWGNRPRVDEIFDDALKGLDNRHATFHYKLGTNHALLCPAGSFALVPCPEEGEITYDGGKWRAKRMKRGLFRRSGQKNLGKLESKAEAQANALQRALYRALPERSETPVHPILVFIHNDAYVKVDDSPILTVHSKKLKSMVRRLPKAKSLSAEEIESLAEVIGL